MAKHALVEAGRAIAGERGRHEVHTHQDEGSGANKKRKGGEGAVPALGQEVSGQRVPGHTLHVVAVFVEPLQHLACAQVQQRKKAGDTQTGE